MGKAEGLRNFGTLWKPEIMTALIPVEITNILVAYFCHTATATQRLLLDEWICPSDENMRVFYQCQEVSLT